MDPEMAPARAITQRLPRASGDGPDPAGVRWRDSQAAPRERGWTREGIRVGIDKNGCPARAGMDPSELRSMRWTEWLPRASGDGPVANASAVATLAAAPRERGWTP